MDTSYTIIEDIFGEHGGNQTTAARGFVGRSHVPEDMRPRNEMIQDLTDYDRAPSASGPMYRQPQRLGFDSDPSGMGMRERGNPRFDFRDIDAINGLGNMRPMPPPQIMEPRPPMFDHISCRDAFSHIENCPVCSNYFKKDIKFYWLIIVILVVVIIVMSRK